MQDLGAVNDPLDADSYSIALGINDQGQIVGISASADFGAIRAFVEQNGKPVDLNSLVAGTTSLDLITACSINADGSILGLAFDTRSGEMHGYLATPGSNRARRIESRRRNDTARLDQKPPQVHALFPGGPIDVQNSMD